MRRITLAALTAGLFLSLGFADVDRGVQLYQEGKFAEAENELRQAVNANGNDARAHRYLGLALLEQHKADAAAEHVMKANELEPTGETKLALAMYHIEKKEFDKADAAINEASGDDLEYTRGLLRFHQGRNEDAVKDLESYMQKKPDAAYAHYYAGLAYSKLRKTDKMMSHFDTFLQLKPNAPEARKVRAVLSTGR